MDILAALDGAGAKADNRPLNAPPEKLDYAHVDAVDDVEELAWILGTLRRGVHGRYPDLEQHVEQRMLALSAPAVQAQAARLQAPPATPDEIAAAEQELAAWEAEAQARDRGLRSKGSGAASSSRTLPPVRNSPASPSPSSEEGAEAHPTPPASQQQEHKAEAAVEDESATPAPDPRSTAPQAPASPASMASTASSSSAPSDDTGDNEGGADSPQAPKGEPTPLRVEVRSVDDAMVEAVLELTRKSEALGVSVSGLSVTGLREAAREAKEEGNARFKGGDFEGAIERYTASLAYDSSSVEHAAVAYANRALARLKMGRLVEAEADCTLALERDGGYAKALLRRAQARFRQGKWAGAKEDAEALLRLEEGPGPVGAKEVKEAWAMLAALAQAEAKGAGNGSGEAAAVMSAPAQQPVEPEPPTAAVVEKEQKEEEMSAVMSAVLVGPRPGYRRVVITEEDEEEEEGAAADQAATAAAPSAASSAPTQAQTEAEALKEAGNAALKGGNLQGAIDAYTQALALAPAPATRAALLNNRSFAFLRSGAFEKARADAGAVVELEPGNVKALYRRAKAAGAQAGTLLASDSAQAVALVEGAVGDLEAALAVDPQNIDVRREFKAYKELLARASAEGAKGKNRMLGEGKEAKQPPAIPSPAPIKPRVSATAAAAATTAAPAPSSSSSSLLQEVTTRPRFPTAKPGPEKPPQPQPQPQQPPKQQEQEQEQKENAAPSITTTTKPAAAATAASASPVSPPPSIPIREPSGPPKTMNELEREWRTLRKSPPALARYLKKFPLTAFPRVFKSATDPDVVSGLFRVVAEEMCGGGEGADAEAAARVLEGMTKAEGFGMLRMMLSKADQAHVKRALEVLEGVGGKEGVAALREKYKM